MIDTDRVRVTTVIRTDPTTAFEVFTGEIDAWWKRDPQHRPSGGAVRFDGGRLLEGETEVARVVQWEPGARVLLEWLTWEFRPGERTEVEVRFEAVGDGTRVTVEHRGWERRLKGAEVFRTVVGLWWGALLPGYARQR